VTQIARDIKGTNMPGSAGTNLLNGPPTTATATSGPDFDQLTISLRNVFEQPLTPEEWVMFGLSPILSTLLLVDLYLSLIQSQVSGGCLSPRDSETT
jgi:hypothetical protein